MKMATSHVHAAAPTLAHNLKEFSRRSTIRQVMLHTFWSSSTKKNNSHSHIYILIYYYLNSGKKYGIYIE